MKVCRKCEKKWLRDNLLESVRYWRKGGKKHILSRLNSRRLYFDSKALCGYPKKASESTLRSLHRNSLMLYILGGVLVASYFIGVEHAPHLIVYDSMVYIALAVACMSLFAIVRLFIPRPQESQSRMRPSLLRIGGRRRW